MAALRALVASRLAVTAAFAPRPGLCALPFGGAAQSPRAAFHASAPRPVARVAVVLSGCGVYDGTELHEASSILVHLSRAGAEVQIFAPDIPQMHVIDHTKGQPSEGETRNVLTESARIARGKITDLAKLSAANHDAAVFPGGFGAAKNLLCCIAPVLAAKVLRSVEVTVGHEQEEGGRWPHAGTAQVIKALGAKHCVTGVTEAHVDRKNKVVTTPAFMCDTAFHHIHDGLGAMVSKVLELASK
ncbi:glutamine amidotransferase-like class 1 domain-containing protein 3, mitochondrial isoform X2 [Delphinus delphis]|uniref:Glutamine amidotransferase-like class 1 domain-containing protein 3A, mitochondrial isoform X2 n=1 Tax=Tursiops truncatus TaxID=9739 RepID=A0A6J3RBE6_TURTR|nr:glutamine amidotransferase-like class 1 domain-containing protein 3A, mitochondrial isoform X2 [Tursiops truncatus]XP_059866223.1 glutamine amidotransferase-like class 1 domain-containing protein 3, mitochondrial isoform X2 [Delphinus delphis]